MNSKNFRTLEITLGAVFMALGAFTLLGQEEAARFITWIRRVPRDTVVFISLLEIAGGLGLLLPPLTKVDGRVTVWSAVALTILMSIVVGFHLIRNDMPGMLVYLAAAGLAAWVAYEWLTRHSLRAR